MLYILIQLVALRCARPRTRQIRRYGIGGSRFSISRESWTNFDAGGTGRFRFRVCDKRYPELAPNPFRFWARRISPKWFAHVHPRYRTPDVAIITYAAAAFVLSFSSTFQKLAVLSNMVVLLLYILCCLAALELNRRDVRSDGAPFKFRGQTVVPIVAIVFIVWVPHTQRRMNLSSQGFVWSLHRFSFLIRQLLIDEALQGLIHSAQHRVFWTCVATLILCNFALVTPLTSLYSPSRSGFWAAHASSIARTLRLQVLRR